MLFVVELLLLAAGIWSLISGRLPSGLLRLLFGRGDYSLPSAQARWYGLLLASPLPASTSVSVLLAVLLGERSTGPAVAFESIYLLAVILLSILIARRIRRSPEATSSETIADPSQAPQARGSYGARLLIIFGLAVFSCVAIGGIGTLLMGIAALAKLGPKFTAELPQALPSFLLSAVVIAVGTIGSLRLLRLLRS